MTKEEFKKEWESNDAGGGITYDVIAKCAKEWGLFSTPETSRIDRVTYAVLKAANCIDAEEYAPLEEDV